MKWRPSHSKSFHLPSFPFTASWSEDDTITSRVSTSKASPTPTGSLRQRPNDHYYGFLIIIYLLLNFCLILVRIAGVHIWVFKNTERWTNNLAVKPHQRIEKDRLDRWAFITHVIMLKYAMLSLFPSLAFSHISQSCLHLNLKAFLSPSHE